jgi:hypothetical protein
MKRNCTSHLSELTNSSDMKKEQSLVLALHGPSGLPQTLQTILKSKNTYKNEKRTSVSKIKEIEDELTEIR